MNKKSALLLFGHMRTYKKCFPPLKKHVIDVYNPDIFIHTWDENESKTESHHSSHMNVHRIAEKEQQKIIDLYKPKLVTFNNQKITDYETTCPNNRLNAQGQKFMIYSFFKANELKKLYEQENNFKYEKVIKIRPDIILKKSFDYFNTNITIEDEKIYVAGNKVDHGSSLCCYRALDIVGVCNSRTMDKVADIYNNFDKFYMKTDFEHSAFIDFLVENNIKIELLNYNYGSSWSIKRDAGSK